MLSERIRKDIANIITKHGCSITIYDPAIARNAEGDPTFTLDAGTSATAAVFILDPDEMRYTIEGIDINNSYRCFFEYDQTIDKDTIIKYNSIYYKVFSIAKIYESNDVCFYNIVISSCDFNIA